MKESQEHVSTLHMSAPAEFIKIFPSAYSMTFTNGQPSLVTALTRRRNFSQIIGSGSGARRVSELFLLRTH